MSNVLPYIEGIPNNIRNRHMNYMVQRVMAGLFYMGYVEPPLEPQVVLGGKVILFTGVTTPRIEADLVMPMRSQRDRWLAETTGQEQVNRVCTLNLSEISPDNSMFHHIVSLGELITPLSVMPYDPKRWMPVIQYNNHSGTDSKVTILGKPHVDITGIVAMFHYGDGFTEVDPEYKKYLELKKEKRSQLFEERSEAGELVAVPAGSGDITFMDGREMYHRGGTYLGVEERASFVFTALDRSKLF